jgi:hypothetical protein
MADQGAGGVSRTLNTSPAANPNSEFDQPSSKFNDTGTTQDSFEKARNKANMTAEEGAVSANQTALPKCFCDWKHCRSYQKSFRDLKHPIFNGVVKLKFIRDDHKSMELKRVVEQCLSVDSSKRNEWRMEAGVEQCRYYIARHHFTEAHIERFLSDRRAWDWNEPLKAEDAKVFLWKLESEYRYRSENEESESEEEDEDSEETDSEDEDESELASRHHYRFIQAPNVPKEIVRETMKRFKLHKENPSVANPPMKARKPTDKKKGSGGTNESQAGSVTTLPTLPSTVSSTLNQFEEIIGHEEPGAQLLAQKEEENLRLRQELDNCQEQLHMLHDMVRQLKDDMDRTRAAAAASVPAPTPAPAPPKVPGKKKKTAEERKNRVQRNHSNNSDPNKFPHEIQVTEDEEDEDWSEQNNARVPEDEEDEEDEEGWSHRGGHSVDDDDDETISTFHHYTQNRSSHSRHGSRHSVRRSSIHSKRHSIRRNSVHSRRDSIHSRKSIRGGMDDAASVHSRASIQSVSPSIKSLPREIQLMEEEEKSSKNREDDCSFFDDSRSKMDGESVGSRSANSIRRRSIRRRGPGSRVGTRNKNKKGSVPKEIDLSGDELDQDQEYQQRMNVNGSQDTSFVTERNIVDPYGEKGVYTGALSKSTLMPNGKGRLEYEKEGRWYEGDWIHGRWTGYGRLSNGDGDFYEGGLKNDHKHGTGVMKFADGRVFEGEYIRGQMIQGKMTYQDGSIYGGSWVDGMRHGRGKCLFVDGSEYEGEFREGNFHGHGKMTWNDGGWYIGEWCDGEMHGKGKEIRPDGSLRHDGEWSRGQPIRSANDSQQHRRRRNNTNAGVEVKI